jgi:hypothetical protein
MSTLQKQPTGLLANRMFICRLSTSAWADARGKKALVADSYSILVMAYYLLKRRQPHSDLDANNFDQHR